MGKILNQFSKIKNSLREAVMNLETYRLANERFAGDGFSEAV